MRTYTKEEKQAVIDRVISGEPSAHILADTGIPKSTFYSWLRIYQEEQNAAIGERWTSAISIYSKTRSHVWRASLKFSNLHPARRERH